MPTTLTTRQPAASAAPGQFVEFNRCVTPADFARTLGVTEESVRRFQQPADGGDFRYARLTSEQRDRAILKAVRPLVADDLPRAGSANLAKWENGWGENLALVRENGLSWANLQPRYFHYDTFRYQGDYIRVASPTFEQDYYTLVRRVLFQKWLAGIDSVVEFGCGTGTSLMLMLEQFPNLSCLGCDWSRPSQEILSIVSREKNWDLTGVRFDMFHPEQTPLPHPGGRTAVVTMHALEQIGSNHSPVLKTIESLKPAVCIHLEPIAELYDPENLYDYVALQYHRRRNYLDGFLSELKAREQAGTARILEVRRLQFGSFFQEGYSLIVWQPVTDG